MVPTQNLGHQRCVSVEKLPADLEVAAKRDERARGRELKRVAGERERQLWEEIEFKKQIIDEPGVKVIDISFDFESVGHQAQQYRLCFAFAEIKITVFYIRLRRRGS